MKKYIGKKIKIDKEEFNVISIDKKRTWFHVKIVDDYNNIAIYKVRELEQIKIIGNGNSEIVSKASKKFDEVNNFESTWKNLLKMNKIKTGDYALVRSIDPFTRKQHSAPIKIGEKTMSGFYQFDEPGDKLIRAINQKKKPKFIKASIIEQIIQPDEYTKYGIYRQTQNISNKNRYICYNINWDSYDYPTGILKLGIFEVDDIEIAKKEFNKMTNRDAYDSFDVENVDKNAKVLNKNKFNFNKYIGITWFIGKEYADSQIDDNDEDNEEMNYLDDLKEISTFIFKAKNRDDVARNIFLDIFGFKDSNKNEIEEIFKDNHYSFTLDDIDYESLYEKIEDARDTGFSNQDIYVSYYIEEISKLPTNKIINVKGQPTSMQIINEEFAKLRRKNNKNES